MLITFQECTVRYGLSTEELRRWLEAGLLEPAPEPDAIIAPTDPDELPRLARLHHDFGLTPEALDLVQTLRQRLVRLQAALAHETARTRALEAFLHRGGLEDL